MIIVKHGGMVIPMKGSLFTTTSKGKLVRKSNHRGGVNSVDDTDKKKKIALKSILDSFSKL